MKDMGILDKFNGYAVHDHFRVPLIRRGQPESLSVNVKMYLHNATFLPRKDAP
jgi:hypothetical protein